MTNKQQIEEKLNLGPKAGFGVDISQELKTP
jgi:hypothetical protein